MGCCFLFLFRIIRISKKTTPSKLPSQQPKEFPFLFKTKTNKKKEWDWTKKSFNIINTIIINIFHKAPINHQIHLKIIQIVLYLVYMYFIIYCSIYGIKKCCNVPQMCFWKDECIYAQVEQDQWMKKCAKTQYLNWDICAHHHRLDNDAKKKMPLSHQFKEMNRAYTHTIWWPISKKLGKVHADKRCSTDIKSLPDKKNQP